MRIAKIHLKNTFLITLSFWLLTIYNLKAQQNAVVKLDECEIVIYGAAHGSKLNRIRKDDTIRFEVVSIFEQEIQGKIVKIKSDVADSISLEQSYQTNIIFSHIEAWYECKEYQYNSSWEQLKVIGKWKFKIKRYNKKQLYHFKLEKDDYKKLANLALRYAKKANDTYMKQHIKDSNWKAGYEVLEVLTEIHLKVTLFMKDKSIVQKYLIFDYHYGC